MTIQSLFYLFRHLTTTLAILLTTWHLGFATIMTQIMARFTSILDSRKKVPMTGRVYLRAIVPIGVMFSLSLIAGNVTYLFLSVSFIQMLKVSTWDWNAKDASADHITGHYTSRYSPCKLDHGNSRTKPQDPRQRLHHRARCHHCLVR